MVSRKEIIKMNEKEPGTTRESLTDEAGCYARIRTAHCGVELWRYRSVINNGYNLREINAPASEFKTLTEFILYVQKVKN